MKPKVAWECETWVNVATMTGHSMAYRRPWLQPGEAGMVAAAAAAAAELGTAALSVERLSAAASAEIRLGSGFDLDLDH